VAEARPRGASRLARLWLLYAGMDLLFIARGPTTALAFLFSDVVVGLGGVTAAFLLAERFDGIGPWTRPQVLFLLGYALTVRGAVTVLFSYNVAHISRRIGRGQLDHLLIQPQPLWMALLSEGFAPLSGAGSLLPGLALLAWAAHGLGLPPSAGWLALLALNAGGSLVIVMAFAYLWGSIAFWAPRAAEEINSSSAQLIDGLQQFPLDALGAAARGGLLTVVPVGFAAWYPCRALLGLDTVPYAVLLTPLAALAAAALASWVFATGLRQYGRTGSTRYLPHGHRR